MKRIQLTRFVNSEAVTFGVMHFGCDPEPVCYTVEKPWANNAQGVSCIPVGAYTIRKCQTGKTMPSEYKGQTYEVLDVQGRTHIKIHIANCPSELEGCIAPNMSIDLERGCGGNSTGATRLFMQEMAGDEEATLIIREV